MRITKTLDQSKDIQLRKEKETKKEGIRNPKRLQLAYKHLRSEQHRKRDQSCSRKEFRQKVKVKVK